MLPKLIFSIRKMSDFERFLKREDEWGILMHFHLNLLPAMLNKAHQHHKKIIVHIDLIQGLASDEYAVQYVTQILHVDGVASIKQRVLQAAKKAKVVTIQRMFLIDSNSLRRSLVLYHEIQPDYVEILPALASQIIQRLKNDVKVPILCGGLLDSIDDIDDCFRHGAGSITLSNLALIDAYAKKR